MKLRPEVETAIIAAYREGLPADEHGAKTALALVELGVRLTIHKFFDDQFFEGDAYNQSGTEEGMKKLIKSVLND